VSKWTDRAEVYEALALNTLQTAETVRKFDSFWARKLEIEAGHLRATAEMVREWAKQEVAPMTTGERG
jgi:hypothetical protein